MCNLISFTLYISCVFFISVRLFQGDSDFGEGAGRLELFHINRWGTICNHGFLPQAAHVACRNIYQHDYDYGEILPPEEIPDSVTMSTMVGNSSNVFP